jgi:hypothetical protein
LATTPVHATLNVLFSVLESEARLACLSAGLDAAIPLLHSPARSRDSLALDAMETARHFAESWVLDCLKDSAWRASDYVEQPRGSVRVLAPWSHRLAETGPLWARHLGPVVEEIVAALAASADTPIGSLPTRLTQANRSAGRDARRRKPRTVRSETAPTFRREICRGCGTEVSGERRWCDDCRPDVKLQAARAGLVAARALRTRLHQDGLDPAASPASRVKQREARLQRRAEEVAWDRTHPDRQTPEVFAESVLPAIAAVPIRRLAKLTGLSVGYCALIRRGLRVPHPRWWEMLASVGRQHI